eukprot:394648-Hanusia_phi.AAC.1
MGTIISHNVNGASLYNIKYILCHLITTHQPGIVMLQEVRGGKTEGRLRKMVRDNWSDFRTFTSKRPTHRANRGKEGMILVTLVHESLQPLPGELVVQRCKDQQVKMQLSAVMGKRKIRDRTLTIAIPGSQETFTMITNLHQYPSGKGKNQVILL